MGTGPPICEPLDEPDFRRPVRDVPLAISAVGMSEGGRRDAASPSSFRDGRGNSVAANVQSRREYSFASAQLSGVSIRSR